MHNQLLPRRNPLKPGAGRIFRRLFRKRKRFAPRFRLAALRRRRRPPPFLSLGLVQLAVKFNNLIHKPRKQP
jgi:hypothetical protein